MDNEGSREIVIYFEMHDTSPLWNLPLVSV